MQGHWFAEPEWRSYLLRKANTSVRVSCNGGDANPPDTAMKNLIDRSAISEPFSQLVSQIIQLRISLGKIVAHTEQNVGKCHHARVGRLL